MMDDSLITTLMKGTKSGRAKLTSDTEAMALRGVIISQ